MSGRQARISDAQEAVEERADPEAMEEGFAPGKPSGLNLDCCTALNRAPESGSGCSFTMKMPAKARREPLA